jgi:hypothetical protein
MEKTAEVGGSTFVRRHLSQLKVLCRLLEHELELAKGDEVVFDKHLLENTLDCIEIFIEDTEGGPRPSGAPAERKVAQGEAKPQVTRLN